jgi:hypothetical protein
MDGFWPTLPDARQRFVAEIASVMRKICASDKERDGAVGDLGVRVMRPHDAINIANKNRFDLERAKLAVTAFGMIVSVGFDLNQGRKKQWMHDLMRD